MMVLTVLLVGELCQCRRERAWLQQVRASYRALFPPCPVIAASLAALNGWRCSALLHRIHGSAIMRADGAHLHAES